MASSQQQLHDTLSSAVATVQAKRVQFEDSVVRPGLDRTKQLGSDYPVGATFLTVFTVLSLVPILSFLAFVSFVAVAAFVGAAVFVSSVIFGAVVLALCFLIPTLFFTISIAVFAIVSLVLGFLVVRLYAHLRSSPTLPSALQATQQDLLTLLSPELSLAHSLLPSSTSSSTTSKSDLPTLDGKVDEYLDLTKKELERRTGEAEEVLREVKQEADGATGGVKVKGE